MASSKTVDLTKGNVTGKLFLFALPLLMTYLLQHFYTVADRVVVGQFAQNGEAALAAVGATSSATNLFLGLFSGLAIGANIICANLRGAKKGKELSQAMHTAILLAAICGTFIAIFGVLLAKPMLRLMGTPEDVLDKAALYMSLYLAGAPASVVYNFGAGILRAHGDTKRPMYILSLSGLVNVGLNLLFVVVCKRDVDGVAIATVMSQVCSAAAVLLILFSPKGDYKLQLKQLRLHKQHLFTIIKVGVPCGLNGMVFSLSNVILQSSLNSFNSMVIIAGKTAALDISTILYQVVASFYSACVSFSGQCYGAGEYKRIDQLFVRSMVLTWCILLPLATVCTIFPRPLLSIFNSNPQVIESGVGVLLINCWGYMIYTVSEVGLGCLRGMRRSAGPTFMNLLAICVPRLIWVFVFFPMHRTVEFLYLCYPISWLISAVLQTVYYLHCRKKMHT